LDGTISEEEYERRESMARSKIMNISYVWNNVGFVVCCALSLAALAGIGANDSTAQNNWGYSVSVAVCTGFWIILAVPWFLWEKKRPGPQLPKGDNYLTFGFKQTYFTMKQAWRLKQTFYYLVAFFLLADGIGTTITLVSSKLNMSLLWGRFIHSCRHFHGRHTSLDRILHMLTVSLVAQTQAVAFSATQNTYYIMVQGYIFFKLPTFSSSISSSYRKDAILPSFTVRKTLNIIRI
jgi:MFS-type transporter involved in bile tolerance (Atg22 family)